MSTTRAVTALAALIHESQQRRSTATGVALDVDSAGMLMSPETAAELVALRAGTGSCEVLREMHAAAEQENVRLRERVAELEAARPSRGNVTPSQVDAYLRTVLSEDTYLRFQQTIGEYAIAEAIEDAGVVRASADNDGLYNADWREGWDDAIERIDPDRNGASPSSLVTLDTAVPAPSAEPAHPAPCRWPASPYCTCGPIDGPQPQATAPGGGEC